MQKKCNINTAKII